MKELRNVNKIEKTGFNEVLNEKTYFICGVEYVLKGGEFSAGGVMNYLKPVENILKNLEDGRVNLTYAQSRSDVEYYVKNKVMLEMRSI